MRILIAGLSLVCALSAYAQQWPTKPVRLIVPNSAGSATDVAARIFADLLSRRVGQSVVVENRPGGDQLVGAQAALASAPDGYSLFFTSQGTLAIDPHLRKSMPFDPAKDFVAIAVICDDTGPTTIFAHPSQPYTTLQGLVEHAKANPGKITYATTVPLFTMLGEWLQHRAGVKLTEVRYKNTPQATQDAIAGQVALYITAYRPMEPHIKAGRLRPLAITVRQDDLAHIPTVADVYPGFAMLGNIFLVGQARIPAEVVARINAATAEVVKDPAFNQQTMKALRWRNVGGARTPQGAAEYISYVRETWGKFIQEAGLKPQ